MHFTEGKVDRIYLVYNRFINTMTQKASFDQLLPLPAPKSRWLRTTGITCTSPTRQPCLST